MVLNESFNKSINEKSILYELLVYSEWFNENDLNFKKFVQSAPSIRSFISSLNPARLIYSASSTFDYKNVSDVAWKLACSQDGMVVAIVQDNVIEIRTSKDGYVSVVGKPAVGYDELPFLRRVCWSTDSTALAVARSSGAVSLYSLLGSHLVTIPAESTSPVVLLTFLNTKFKNTKWSSELLIVQYDGTVRSFLLSALDCHASEENIRFSLADSYDGGVTSAVYHASHHLLIVAGQQPYSKDGLGVTAWRILSGAPYLSPALGENCEKNNKSWLRFMPFRRHPPNPCVTDMKVSPNGQNVVCLGSDGSVSFLAAPSLRLLKSWPLEQQGLPTVEAELNLSPVHVEWWSDDAIVLVRRNGSVTVCSTETLENVLGEGGEVLCGPPQVAAVRGGRQSVLILDCEKHRSPNQLEETEEVLDDEASILQASIQAALYSVTDIETFQPVKRPARVVQKTYRLLGIKSITPEELYLRKIENGAFEEALLLAQTYGLDCDLVYQRQWRTNPVSAHTINSYLSKVSRADWVIRECIERVPDSFLAAHQLLNFGLDVTDCEGEEQQDKRATIKARLKILYYLDGLKLYEKMLKDHEEYDSVEYESLRRVGSLEAAVSFARAERRDAVAVMFSFRSAQVLPHYLPILSNLPETLRPTHYRTLLPELSADGQHVVPWETLQLREKDWAEDEQFRDLWDAEEEDGSVLYAEDPSLKRFNVAELTPELVKDWYKTRAFSIERSSGLVENAALLLRLAKEKNVQGLEDVYFDLVTLECLVRLGDDETDIEKLRRLPYLDQAQLLMRSTEPSSFVNDLKQRVVPFVVRCQERGCASKAQLLKGLLHHYASTDLLFPRILMEHLKEHSKCPLSLSVTDMMDLALNCIYTYPQCDQLEHCFAILECLPEKTDSEHLSDEERGLHKKIDELEKHLQVSEILEKSSCGRSVQSIRDDVMTDPQLARAVLEQVAASDTEPTAESTELLDDLLELQAILSTVEKQYCYQLFANNRLNSGVSECIAVAEEYLACWSKETWKAVPYAISVKLILDAANSYLDRSTGHDDPLVKLAEQCLKMINEAEEKIQACLDLIEALLLLGHFNVRVLPLQVRMMSHRWPLIEKCLRSGPEAYKSTELLIQLAQSLRLENHDRTKREGEVLVMVAKAALEAGDIKYCSDVCCRLMTRCYIPAWHLLQTVGSSSATPPSKQQEFLSFAILHCPAHVLDDVIQARVELRAGEAKYQKMCLET